MKSYFAEIQLFVAFASSFLVLTACSAHRVERRTVKKLVKME